MFIKEQILNTSTIPANISENYLIKAQDIAKTIAEKLNILELCV
jgi:phosphoribosylaminoimidazole carboxylase (NCAIR synthetase)